MPATLLASKLNMPLLRTDFVPRQHLLDRLNTGLWQAGGFLRKLTLVSASAGYGKTTLIADWLTSVQQPATWLTLDESDNDPAQFLTYLIRALQQVDAGLGEAVQSLLQSSQPPPAENVLTALINEIAGGSASFILVLDDYQVIHTRAVHDQLGFILQHQPHQMHLVVATREDPLLPISRLRARGQLFELRQEDLRFSTHEIAEFFHRTVGLDLPAADLAILEDRTEGWVTGLQLAALSMRRPAEVRNFVRAFAESDRFILDYLFEEVMSNQPADVQDFLVRTSILDKLTGPLCDAVADRTGSHELLQALEHANLFIVPLEPTRTWYRYHHLFAELLRHRLRIVGEPQAARLHEQASQWYESKNHPFEAIQHALAAHAWQRAARLIDNITTAMLRRGQVTTLLRWIRMLPDDVVLARPDLCLDHGWASILTGQLDEAERYLSRATQIAGNDPAVLGNVLVGQASIARARGENEQAIELAQRALTVLPTVDALERSMVALTLGLAQAARGNLTAAEQALTEAHEAARVSRNHYAGLTAFSLLGAMQLARGRLHQAADTCKQVLDSGGPPPPTATALLVLGVLKYEWNDLEAAVHHLERGVDLCQLSGNREIQVDCLVSLAQLRLSQGDSAAALRLLDRTQRVANAKSIAPVIHAKIAACRVALALAQHDLSTARHWAEQVAQNTASSLDHPRIGLAEVALLLAENRQAVARQILESRFEAASTAGLSYVVVEIRALQALAAPSLAEALSYLEEALVLAEPEGYIRTFVDKGEPMAALLQAVRSQRVAPRYVAELLAAFGAEKRGAAAQARTLQSSAERGLASSGVDGPAEPLSERELEVLRLVTDGLTNQEIAERLVVTVGTVKTHVHHIFGKLNVRSRAEAAARARAYNL